MKRVHIIGGKNHGKTTLVVDLVREFGRQGLQVGTIKHTHHQHELDTPGKDSHRHRHAGAAVVGIISRGMNAVFLPPSIETGEPGTPTGKEAQYATVAPLFSTCDLVLVEGDLRTTATRVEVWRSALGTPPIAQEDPRITAVVTDDAAQVAVPLWPRSDVKIIAQNILKRIL